MVTGKYTPLTLSPINFSLTDGTAIPAPPDSPPSTPRLPTPGKGPLSSHPTSPAISDPPTGSTVLSQTTTNDGAASSIAPSALSPTFSKRPSSVRKFLGLRTLSSSDSLKSASTDRPGSPLAEGRPSLSRKKSGSWFGKRKSSMVIGRVDEVGEKEGVNGKALEKENRGPPPPALPELRSLGVSEEAVSLGAEDMFKDIK
ncbi:hypothetical protein K432DRAFT_293766 [Lepidopterella palustris CBS 459.81]|uniref:Uncharacterized protein n=1 Tax=Lepidopterella palustris CBS 459.81 TaxID=1314670 RepID=A0A8E2EDZ9_9PEZI|nr:hypothetical protein K432DRAFT_293766 [Lepidopterella palustris CBS 459.81]